MTSLLLRPTEAAEQLGIGRTKIYELMSAGALAYVKIGVLRRIPYAALEKFVAEHETTTESASHDSDAPAAL
ncbi:helix-turn-helix domain-containing protein [Mumia sp. Pv 4-285]|uniref:helix-turn-helix domain-containing protein n=1 Tax=Mumia qirimensis TaxID=3234852 RepID=UPI00351D3AE0